ncbi:5'-nucleotidase SurE [Anatilimnocola aggregata]|uniref:5'-nucleotidase SurE n=1 Tax=Anatilimnocola aggregata TaxID=2528021 RepID=A0A517YP03_9BACT|nr:5'/3'-nucleotidase SurE [Anatilimnocola aggregata]QDU31939.1 5'-nucleotidase SurE [Anatilimnocola aggregata]
MLILLTNDDGIYAPGLRALEEELRQIAEVRVVAPATEQSGVGHSITFLRPLVPKEVYDANDRLRGWAVDGSPADCVKLGIFEFCQRPPDIVVSGINGGLNAGINVLYSGTVAAAIEGAFFGITSIACSLEYHEHAQFRKAAKMCRSIIEQILERKGPEPVLYNLNIPTAATNRDHNELKIVPMGVSRYGEDYVKGVDPKGRTYYWATNDPPPRPEGYPTDLTEIAKGYLTLTPLQYNMTRQTTLAEMEKWTLSVPTV